MALPGVTSVIKDKSQTLSRTDVPEDVKRVGIIARRGSVAAGDPLTVGTGTAAADYDPFVAPSEEVVVDHFGENSELHRGYLEAVAGGAGRVVLIPVESTVTDGEYVSDTAPGNAFDAAFDAVEAAQIDIVVPWGRGSHPLEWQSPATPGDDPGNFGFAADDAGVLQRVANKCREITDRSYPLFAVLGVKPYIAGAQNMTVAELQSHIGLSGLPDRDTIGDNGAFVSVVATELAPTGYDAATYGYANGAATYAGFVSSLSEEVAPTAQPLFNVAGLRYTVTRPQQTALIDKGVVPVATDFSRRAVVVDGLTFAKATSDYTRLTTLRVVFGTVQLVRRACRSFIGKPATLHHRSSMETAIFNRLRALQIGGVLLNSDFTVEYRPSENKAIVNLVLQPAFEMRNIDISVSVQL